MTNSLPHLPQNLPESLLSPDEERQRRWRLILGATEEQEQQAEQAGDGEDEEQGEGPPDGDGQEGGEGDGPSQLSKEDQKIDEALMRSMAMATRVD